MPANVARNVLAVALFAAVAVVMLSPAASVVHSNSGTQHVGNESVTASYNTSLDLTGYDITNSTVTVYGYNQTSGSYEQASHPDDYTVHTKNGSISFNSSSSLIDSGETVKVSYNYQATGTTTTLVEGFLPLMLGLVILVGVARGVMGLMG